MLTIKTAFMPNAILLRQLNPTESVPFGEPRDWRAFRVDGEHGPWLRVRASWPLASIIARFVRPEQPQLLSDLPADGEITLPPNYFPSPPTPLTEEPAPVSSAEPDSLPPPPATAIEPPAALVAGEGEVL